MRYDSTVVPSERIQRQINRLLDEAETASAEREWTIVRDRAEHVLTFDPENADARALLEAANRGLNSSGPAPSTSTPSATGSLPGSLAGGRYRVQRLLGEGGRKRVYLARDTRLERDVAVAVIKSEGLDLAGLERVQREARAMARLGDHPNIVTVFDVADEDGQPLLVSQYMAGGSVEDLLARADGHCLPVDETLRIAEQVCQALEHAHRRGVIHRDLKPGNVFLSAAREGAQDPNRPELQPGVSASREEGRPGLGSGHPAPPLVDTRGRQGDGLSAKLGDFGLAVALDRSRLTMAGMMLGTVAYMPPEQALGGETTAKADLYSLGCMLYEMVTGRPPFLGDDPTAVISQHINTPPVAPSWLTQHCPPELEEVIIRLLAKSPDDRPASAAEVREALLRVDPEKKSQSHSDSSENPLDRLARGVFVGRKVELERLRKAFDDAFAGRGGLAMLVGEPGIGKTRTSQELETYARMRGAQVFWGRTHESGGAPAFWPWYQVGNQYAAANDIALVGPQLPPGANSELSRIFPWLRQQPDFVEPETIAEPEAAQFRLFDAFAAFLRAMAAPRPVVIVLDDLHWADKPSLLLLQYLARELSRLRVLVLGTYRDTDITRQSPLMDALGVLNREPGFDRIVLRGLSKQEVANYIQATANIDPRREVLDRIYEETEGNAFFLSEVVNLMAQEGALTGESVSDIRVPDGVREALGRRLNRLSQETNQLLQLAAIVGREFTYDMLTLLDDRDEDALLKLIEEGLEARVIEELPQPGRYRFTHAQMQETLLDELSTTRRVRLHGRVGEALERRWGEDLARQRAPRLAHHFAESATLTPAHAAKALLYSRLAAEHAEQQLAWPEAVRHYEHCLTLLSDASTVEEGLEPELLVALGRSLRMALEPRAAWRNFMRAITIFKGRGDPVGVARATLEAASVPAPSGRVVGLVQEAISLLGDADPYLRARLLLVGAGQFGAFPDKRALDQIEKIISGYDFPDVAAVLAYQRGMRAFAHMQPGEASREFDSAYDVLLQHGRLMEAGSILWVRGIQPLMLGDVRTGKPVLEEALARVRTLHVGLWEVNLLNRVAGLALARGEMEEFSDLLKQIVPNYARDLLQVAQAEIGGDLTRARRLLPGVEAAGGVFPWAAEVHAARARIAFELNDLQIARDELSGLITNLDSIRGDGRDAVPFSIGLFFPVMEAGDALTLLDEKEARKIYDELIACGPVRWDPMVPRGGDQIRGVLALRLGLTAEAERHFTSGLEWAQSEGLPLEEGCCRLKLAELAGSRGQVREALQYLDSAVTVLQRCGARYYVDRALDMKVRLQGIGSALRSIDAVADSIQSEQPDLASVAAADGSVTIFVSDIEDSTALNERLGDTRWLELLREHNAIMRRHIAAHGGHEVKTFGDAFMVVFADPVAALRCAVEVQRDFAAWTLDPPVRVRVGLHSGQALRDRDDFFGTNVTLAFRIAALGHGGQIFVSSLLRDLASSSEAFQFDSGREVELKGLTGAHRIFELTWR